MINLRLTVGQQICFFEGCGEPGSIFGVCKQHEAEAIRAVFEDAVAKGHCPYDAPPCFSTHEKWREYVAAYLISRKDPGYVNQCRDCTPAYKKAMMREGLCEHPETVFIRSKKLKGEVIGVCIDTRFKKSVVWEEAVMGLSGDIVELPPTEVIEQKLAKIAEDNKPKKRGPRFMKDRV